MQTLCYHLAGIVDLWYCNKEVIIIIIIIVWYVLLFGIHYTP